MVEGGPKDPGIFFSCICPSGLEEQARGIIHAIPGIVLAPQEEDIREIIIPVEDNDDGLVIEGKEVKGYALKTEIFNSVARTLAVSDMMSHPQPPMLLYKAPEEIIYPK